MCDSKFISVTPRRMYVTRVEKLKNTNVENKHVLRVVKARAIYTHI